MDGIIIVVRNPVADSWDLLERAHTGMFRHYVMDFKRLFNVISRNNSEVAENDPLRRGSAADPGGRGYGPAVRRMPRLVSHPRTFRHPRESGDPDLLDFVRVSAEKRQQKNGTKPGFPLSRE